MDAEIDAEADEEDGEGDRDQVELADRGEGEGGGPDQSHDQGHEDGAGQPRRAHAEKQQPDHQAKRQRGGQPHALLDALQFLLVQRRRTGEAHAHPVRRHQAELADQGAQRVHGVGGRLQRAEVEGRLDQDQAAPVPGIGLFAGHQPVPGQAGEAARGLRLGDFGDGLDEGADLDRGVCAAARLVDDEGQHVEKAAERGVPPQGAEEGLRLGQAVGENGQILGVHEEKPVAAEEGVPGRVVDGAEEPGVAAERLPQGHRRIIGESRRLAVDDHQDVVGKLREGLVERP